MDNQLAERFPFIVKWEAMMGGFGYYRDAQLQLAATENAPLNATYRSDGQWHTTDDIENPNIVLAWQLSCPNCKGTHAKVKGCKHSRHEIYAEFRRQTGKYAN